MIKLIVGLGNPGPEYEKTRHNVGFIFLDRIAIESGARWLGSRQFHGDVASCSLHGAKVVLLKPATFMNRSGLSVGGVLRFYKLDPEEMLVVHDELDLPEEVVRLKRNGGHAGHNGLRDIIAHLGTRDFYRLRIGIGRPPAGEDISEYVLSRFSRLSSENIENTFGLILGKLPLILEGDLVGSMIQRGNQKRS